MKAIDKERLEAEKAKLEQDLGKNKMQQETLLKSLENTKATQFGIEGGIQVLNHLLRLTVDTTDSHDRKDTADG